MMGNNILFLVDGSALVYRSYFALKNMTTKKGEHTGAVYGFTTTILKVLREEKPDFFAVVFDTPEPTFRHKRYPKYKATREKMPEELVAQLPKIRSIAESLGITVLESPGYEADDVMGTLAVTAAQKNIDTYLFTGDKDFMQLVGGNIRIYNLKKTDQDAEILDSQGVVKKTGLKPQQIRDYFALMGDSSDNVPGVPGVGQKTAFKLIEEFESFDRLYEQLPSVKPESLRSKLELFREQASLSRELVTLDLNVPLDVEIEKLVIKEKDEKRLKELFRELEFNKLSKGLFTPKVSVEGDHNYTAVLSVNELESIIQKMRSDATCLSFDLETTSIEPMLADIVGMSFSWKENEAVYVPIVAENKLYLPLEKVIELLKPVFEDVSLSKCAQNAKYDMLILKRHGIEVQGLECDTMIAAYLLSPGIRRIGLDALSLEYLQYEKIPTSALIGSGKNQRCMADVSLDQITAYACEDADYTLRLKKILEEELKENQLWALFKEVEMPIVRVLVEMEFAGVALNTTMLEEMSERIGKTLNNLKSKIHNTAGHPFNINSPQQLGIVLFEEMEIHKETGVRKPKKTKIGYSTDVNVLEKYSYHPIIKLLQEYRQLQKLKGTYIDALPKLINPKTSRVHTSFNQAVTATGRLSSSNPNLQNIPIRTEDGREIRKAFIPRSADHILISADYSQIELRLVAHLSNDLTLIEAFRQNEDIHRKTASLIFHVPAEEVTDEMRYKAKSINFGIIYGMSPYRLAREIDITPEEAQEFIDAYFLNYPDVHRLITYQIAQAREKGYVTTLLGRKRNIPEIMSDNQRVRKNAENIAVNTPIQGTAAELIKRAMTSIVDKFHKQKLQTRLILQIHDELVFDVPKPELDTVKEIIRSEMEGALELSVPLKVDIGVGNNWFEAH